MTSDPARGGGYQLLLEDDKEVLQDHRTRALSTAHIKFLPQTLVILLSILVTSLPAAYLGFRAGRGFEQPESKESYMYGSLNCKN